MEHWVSGQGSEGDPASHRSPVWFFLLWNIAKGTKDLADLLFSNQIDVFFTCRFYIIYMVLFFYLSYKYKVKVH